MKKYFIASDIHSFLEPFTEALNEVGFDINNKDHILVINGDLFDRGDNTVSLFRFIKHIPKRRRILIKGNHEELFIKLLNKDFPDSYDFSNGTVRTFCSIAGVPEEMLNTRYRLCASDLDFEKPLQRVRETWQRVRKAVNKSSITKWLLSDEWINYLELDNYIITHSFIPTRIKPEVKNINFITCSEEKVREVIKDRYINPVFLNIERKKEAGETYLTYPNDIFKDDYIESIPNWRENATDEEWNNSRWGCPYKLFNKGLFEEEIKNNKILVCGHWHVSDFHEVYENVRNNYNIYYGKNLIAIDACTARTYKCNILTIEK